MRGHDSAPHRQAFDRDQRGLVGSFVGADMVEVVLDEWALYGPDEAPVFHHPDLHFVQALRVQLGFSDGRKLQIGIWQNDDHFALHFMQGEPERPFVPNPDPTATFSRLRELTDFPSGRIIAIAPGANADGAIQEVAISIGGRTMILKAGEVDEDGGGRLRVMSEDESVLIFADRADYERTVFDEWAYRAA